jgi:hypothetical protein
MEYLYGEVRDGKRSEMARHLPECQPCRLRLVEWRGAKGALDEWTLETRAPRRTALSTRAAWGLAACVTLFLGVGLGQLTAARFYDPRRVAEILEPQLRSEIKNATREEAGRWALSARQGLAASVRRDMEAELDKKLEEAAARGGREAEGVMARVAESLDALRETDRNEVLALIKQMQTAETARFASIRKDLETVAIVGETKIQDTQREIGELASASQTLYHPKAEKP